MSWIHKEEKEKIKEELLKLVNHEQRVTRWFAMQIKRSWDYTAKLLTELVKEGKIKMNKIGNLLVWVKCDVK